MRDMRINSEQLGFKRTNQTQVEYGNTGKTDKSGWKLNDNVRDAQDGISLSISKEGIGLLQEQDEEEQEKKQSLRQQKLEEAALKQECREQVQASKKEAEAYRDLAKIMEIARRISNGDRVPAADEKKLMEFSEDLYQTAKAAAMINADKEHKEYDSLFEEEDENDVKSKMRNLERGETDAGKGAVSEKTAQETADTAVEQETMVLKST